MKCQSEKEIKSEREQDRESVCVRERKVEVVQ
jgi:hypothetical protein